MNVTPVEVIMASCDTSTSTTSAPSAHGLNYTVVTAVSDAVPRELQRPWEETSVCQTSMSAGLAGVDCDREDFSHSLRGRAAPDVFLIHCDGNDIGEVSSVQLVNAMKEEVHQLKLRHPGMKIMLSDVTQRCRWKAGVNPVKIDKGRKYQ